MRDDAFIKELISCAKEELGLDVFFDEKTKPYSFEELFGGSFRNSDDLPYAEYTNSEWKYAEEHEISYNTQVLGCAETLCGKAKFSGFISANMVENSYKEYSWQQAA